MSQTLACRIRRTAFAGVGILTTLIVAACSSTGESTAPLTPLASNASWEGDGTGFVRVCKSAGPTGTYTFNTSVVGGGGHVINFGQGAEASLNFTGSEVCLNSGSYIPFGNDPSWTPGMTAAVTVAEVALPAGVEVDKIEVWDFAGFPAVLLNTVTGPTNTVTVTVTATSRIKILFYNKQSPPPPPPPPGGEGCTPGYWKQSQHFESWVPTGYTTSQTLGSVFANSAIYGLDTYTMLQGLSFDGGSSITEAAKILLRASVAAVLNAASPDVDYALSAADIISQVNAALASNDRDTILGLATTLDDENNRGCTLD